MKDVYYHISVKPEDKPKTDIITPLGDPCSMKD